MGAGQRLALWGMTWERGVLSDCRVSVGETKVTPRDRLRTTLGLSSGKAVRDRLLAGDPQNLRLELGLGTRVSSVWEEA